MTKRYKRKNNTFILFVFLLSIGVGIAYAVLTEQLTINNTVSYDAMKWNVGFTSVEDGWWPYVDSEIAYVIEEYGSLEEAGFSSREDFEKNFREEFFNENETYSPTTAEILPDKKTITANCDLAVTSKIQYCAIKATITNDSTFDIALSEDPIITFDDTYISYNISVWLNHEEYGSITSISDGEVIEAGTNADVLFVFVTKELTKEMLPSEAFSIPITIETNFEETEISDNN